MNGVPSGPELKALGEDVEKAAMKAYREEITRQYPDTPGASATIPDDHFKDIPSAFEVFDEPWPTYPKVMADNIAAAIGSEGLGAGEMSSVSALRSTIGDTEGEWTGDAATTFGTYYLDPFMECVTNQKEVLGSLEAGVRTYSDVLEKRRVDAKKIGDKAIEALESLGGCGSAEGALGLSLLGVAVTIIGTAATGGTLGFVMVAGAATALSASVSYGGAMNTSTVNGIVTSMYEALEKVDEDVDDRAKQIAGRLKKNLGLLTGQLATDKDDGNIPVLLPQEPKEEGVSNVTDGGDLGNDFVPPDD